MNFDPITDGKIVTCKCGCNIFEEKVILKKVSRLKIGAPVDVVVPVSVYRCSKCGEIPDEFFYNYTREEYFDDTQAQEEKKSSIIL